MYKNIIKISKENIDYNNKKVFLPFLKFIYIHSFYLNINLLSYGEECGFIIENNFLDISNIDYSIEESDNISIEVNYFYINKNGINNLNCLLNDLYEYRNRISKIITEHYIDGHFSFDNGMYKNAIINFGVVLEGLLSDISGNTLNEKIINSSFSDTIKEKMHIIRKNRNKVHPNRILDSQDITREDAFLVRDEIEQILFIFYKENNL